MWQAMKEAEDYFSSLIPEARVFMLEIPAGFDERGENGRWPHPPDTCCCSGFGGVLADLISCLPAGPHLREFQHLLGLRQRSQAKPRLELVDVLSMFTLARLGDGYADDVHPKDFVQHQAAQLFLTGLCHEPER